MNRFSVKIQALEFCEEEHEGLLLSHLHKTKQSYAACIGK